MEKNYKFFDFIKKLVLACAILLSIKIVYSVGLIYFGCWVRIILGNIQKLLHISDAALSPFYYFFYSIFSVYGTSQFDAVLKNPAIGLLKPGFDLVLVGLVLGGWLLYYFYKKNDNKLIISIDKNDSPSIFLMVLFFSCFVYLVFEIVRCAFIEIGPVFIGTSYLYIAQALLVLNTIVVGFLLIAILNDKYVKFLIKLILGIVVFIVLFAVPSSIVATTLWDQGYVQGILDYSAQKKLSLLTIEQVNAGIFELYELYGIHLLHCNPDHTHPCEYIRKQFETACAVPDFFRQLPLGGRSVLSNAAGTAAPYIADFNFDCSHLRSMLTNCMDDYHRQIWLQHYLENQLRAKPPVPFVKPTVIWPMPPKPPVL